MIATAPADLIENRTPSTTEIHPKDVKPTAERPGQVKAEDVDRHITRVPVPPVGPAPPPLDEPTP